MNESGNEPIKAESIVVTSSEKKEKGTLMWIIGAVVIAVILIFIALYFANLLPGIPMNTVATVNGINISQEDLETQLLRSENYLSTVGGTTLSDEEIKRQVLDGIINQTLLVSAAEDAGIIVTDEEIEEYIGNLKSQFVDEEAFNAELAKNNASYEDLAETVNQQLAIEAYVVSVVGDDVVVPTDEEIQAQYDQLKTMVGSDQELPPLEEIKDLLANEVRLTKLRDAQMSILNDLREDADIEINL